MNMQALWLSSRPSAEGKNARTPRRRASSSALDRPRSTWSGSTTWLRWLYSPILKPVAGEREGG